MTHLLFDLPDDEVSPIREVITLKETTTLARVPEDRFRKDLEKGFVNASRVCGAEHRLLFRWVDSIAVAAIYRNSLLSVEHRKTAWEKFDWSFRRCDEVLHIHCKPSNVFSVVNGWAHGESMRIGIDSYIFIDLRPVIEELFPRLRVYVEGLAKIEEKEGVLGGEAVFKNTRLPVMHIGAIASRGEKIANIVEDYPYLSARDVDFARLYYLAHPSLGRPKTEKVNGRCYSSTK